jgi:Ca2+/Na+ antiporter
MKKIANLLALSGAGVALIALVIARIMQIYWKGEIDNSVVNSRMNAILIVAMILVLSGTLLAVLSRDFKLRRKIVMVVLSLFMLVFWFKVVRKDTNLWLGVESSAFISANATLAELCQLYHTDKCPFHHNYVEFYEWLFRPLKNKTLRFLEIGVLHGESMRLWEAYFRVGQIFGIDIEDKTQYDTARVKTFIADQGKRADLAKIITATEARFDVILDDGGHKMDQQQISFGALFPYLNSGGMYIIEDIHTSFPNLYHGFGVHADGKNTTYAMIDRFVRTGFIRSQYLSPEENKYLSQNISSCAYFFRMNRFHSDFFVCWKK